RENAGDYLCGWIETYRPGKAGGNPRGGSEREAAIQRKRHGRLAGQRGRAAAVAVEPSGADPSQPMPNIMAARGGKQAGEAARDGTGGEPGSKRWSRGGAGGDPQCRAHLASGTAGSRQWGRQGVSGPND